MYLGGFKIIKFKNFFILFMILVVVLLSTTVVFAEDNDTSLGNTNTIDLPESSNYDKSDSKISISDVNNDSFNSNGDDSDLQRSSDNEDKLQATLTLTELKNFINNASGEVTLVNDYVFSQYNDGYESVALYSSSDFILNGNGRYIGFGQSSWVSPKFTGSNIVLKNINFRYYRSIELSGSNVSVINCTFNPDGNSHSDILHLVYSANVSSFTISGCTFVGGDGIGYTNEGVYLSNVIIKDCNFHDQAGSLLQLGDAEIINTNFTSNLAPWYPTARLFYFWGNVSLNNCYFYNLQGSSADAMIYVEGSLNMSNVKFNKIHTAGSDTTAHLIYLSFHKNLTSNWNNVLFEEVNTGYTTFVTKSMIKVTYYAQSNYLYIVNSTFNKNIADSLIEPESLAGDFRTYLINCTSIDNDCHYGVMNCFVYNSSFIHNKGRWGSAGAFASFYNSYFYWNFAAYSGGAIHNPRVIKNCTFVKNSAVNYGGVIGCDDINNNILIENNTFLESEAPNGGVFAVYDGFKEYRNVSVIFKNNVVKDVTTTNGGVFYLKFIKNNLTYLVSNNDFNDISVSGYGGVFYVAESHFVGNLIVKDMDFINISAKSGSVLYQPKISLHVNYTFSNVTLLNNTADVNKFMCYGGTFATVRFIGENNFLNAFNITYTTLVVSLDNVTYWGANGIENINGMLSQESCPGQNISVVLESLDPVNYVTDAQGRIAVPLPGQGQYRLNFRHYADNYYRQYVINYIAISNGNSASLNAFTNVDMYNATITATVRSGVTGIIRFVINDTTYEVPIVNSKAQVNLTNLDVGLYKVRVTYMGDSRYYQSNYNLVFNIVKVKYNSSLIIDASNITVGQKETINFMVNGVKDTLINVLINSKQYLVENGVLVLENLTVGNYSVFAFWAGDDVFQWVSNSTMFRVSPISNTSNVKIEFDGDDIKITLPDDAKGHVIVDINGTQYYAPIVNGTVNFTIPDLKPGTYNLTVIFPGDGNNLAGSNSTLFTIPDKRAQSSLELNLTNGEVKVILSDGATGHVVFDINGTQYYVPVVNGTSSLTIPENLMPGIYNITALYDGDDNFKPSSNSTLFVKSYKPASVNVSVDNGIINVVLPDDAKGYVIVDINGTQYYAPIVDGKVNFTIPADLKPGTYNLTVTYPGDGNYLASSNSTLFSVFDERVDGFIRVSVVDGVAYFVLPVDAKGDVVADINGTKYLAPIVSGKANLTIPTTLEDGVYNLTASHAGDDKYYPSSNSTLFSVFDERVDGFVNVSVVDGVAYFVLPVDAKGDVVVDINGTKYLVPVVDGKANFTIPSDFKPGTYNLTVIYSGDDKYYPFTNSTLFSVFDERVDGFVNVSVVDGVAYFVLPVDAKGDVVVDINGTKYLVPVVDGKANFTIPGDLKPGTYNLTTMFSGDDKYKPCGNSSLFTVKDKTNGFIKVSVVNRVIKVELPSDIDGFVVVCVNNTDYHVDVNAGLGNLSFPSYLDAGIYNITADFLGDNNYAPASNYTMFSYQKENCQIKVKVIADKIVASLPNDSTGYVVIDIGGTKYYVLINNGKAELEIPERLEKGNYTVNASYPGDYKYMSCSNITNLTIDGEKIITIISFERVDTNLTVTGILKDIEGNVLKNKNLTYQINGGSKELICTDGNGIFKLQAVSHSTINVEYAGNSIFKYCNATLILDKFLDIRNLTNIVSEAYDTYAVDFELGERGGYFNFRLVDENNKGLANKPVQIGFCGVIYNRVTDENGYAKLQINLNTPFIFTFAIAFLGDDTHNASFVVQQINVIKKTTTLSAKDMVFKASEKSKKFKVTLNSAPCSSIDGKTYISMGKTVTLNVAGKTYTAKTNALNQAIFKLDLTKKGSYNAKISFAGDVRYGASKTTAKIKIN